jgi:hypothetical protein
MTQAFGPFYALMAASGMGFWQLGSCFGPEPRQAGPACISSAHINWGASLVVTALVLWSSAGCLALVRSKGQ